MEVAGEPICNQMEGLEEPAMQVGMYSLAAGLSQPPMAKAVQLPPIVAS